MVDSLRYADDVAVLAQNEGDLQAIFNRLTEIGIRYGLNINTSKTTTMVISKNSDVPAINVTARGVPLKQVKSFSYLGSLMTSDARSDKEIKRRIALARQAFNSLRDLLRCDISKGLKKRLLKCYVWPVLLYGSESWTVSKEMIKRLESFEMWCYRRILKISYKDHVSNVKVLERMNTKREILHIFQTGKLKYAGHLIREGGLQASICLGKANGKKARGEKS